MPVASQPAPVPASRRGSAVVDFIVVGGGIIGLATALRLRESGARVSVFDRAPGPGAEASGAAAGILSMLYPWEYPDCLDVLARYSRGAWGGLCSRVQELSGYDPEYEACGMFSFDVAARDAARAWAVRHGEPFAELDDGAMRERVPAAAPAAALHFPGVAKLRPRATVSALDGTLGALGVGVRWNTPVSEIAVIADRVQGVRTVDGELHAAGAVIVAAGAWSPELLEPLGIRAGIRPVRGQMLELAGEPGLLPAILIRDYKYIVPRADGSLLVGSTVEERGFDKSVTRASLSVLRAAAAGLVPATMDMKLTGHWAGLRPGSLHGVPAIGRAPWVRGLWLNAGHFRNGITLAAGSAELVAALATGTPPAIDPAPYDPAVAFARVPHD